jgi:ribosomal protein S18 acetylase RimI-like enzyme
MEFKFRLAKKNEINKAFEMLCSAAETLAKKNIEQWQYWKNPPTAKIKWVEVGFKNQEFFFIETLAQKIIGMVRLSEEDLIYWGQMNDKSVYIHSLIIDQGFSGNKIGEKVIAQINEDSAKKNFHYLRLDCDATNLKLCNYYENQNFEKVGLKTLPLGKYNLYEKKIIH